GVACQGMGFHSFSNSVSCLLGKNNLLMFFFFLKVFFISLIFCSLSLSPALHLSFSLSHTHTHTYLKSPRLRLRPIPCQFLLQKELICQYTARGTIQRDLDGAAYG